MSMIIGVTMAQTTKGDYVPMVIEGNVWNIAYFYQDPLSPFPPAAYYMTFVENINGDTVIDGLSYKKLYIEDNSGYRVRGYLREDIKEQKIWYRQKGGFGIEELLYDFSLEAGETFELPPSRYEGSLYLDSITYVNIMENNDIRRKFWFTYSEGSVMSDKETWVEGIGSDLGMSFVGFNFALGGWTELLCAFNGSEQLYQNSNYNTCYMCNLNIDEADNTSISVYPNPVTDKIHISNEQKLPVSSIMIYDISGRLIKSCPQGTTEIDMSDVSTGVYIIRISVEDKVITHKIIK